MGPLGVSPRQDLMAPQVHWGARQADTLHLPRLAEAVQDLPSDPLRRYC